MMSPGCMSGQPCFRGIRVPVRMLMEQLAANFFLDEFLETVPSLEHEKAETFLTLASKQMLECASSLRSA